MKQKKIPQRMCVGCQEMKNKKEMIRVVRSPDGEISIDAIGKKPGRGAYICSSKECFAQAYKQKRLERALSQAIDKEVYETIRVGLFGDE